MCQRLFTGQCIFLCPLCLPSHGNIRDQWWIGIVNLVDIRLSAEWCALTDDDMFLILLGQQTLTQLCLSEYISFRMSEQYRIFPRQWFLIRSSLHSEAEQKLLTWEDDNRSSIQQSDTSYINIKHFDCSVTICLNVYLIFIYVFTRLFFFSLNIHIFSSSCFHFSVYIDFYIAQFL